MIRNQQQQATDSEQTVAFDDAAPILPVVAAAEVTTGLLALDL